MSVLCFAGMFYFYLFFVSILCSLYYFLFLFQIFYFLFFIFIFVLLYYIIFYILLFFLYFIFFIYFCFVLLFIYFCFVLFYIFNFNLIKDASLYFYLLFMVLRLYNVIIDIRYMFENDYFWVDI